MKGLMLKDLLLLKQQKTLFLVIGGLAVGLACLSDDLGFVVGFSSLILSSFSLTSLAYDELNRGLVYLFSLPITRKQYVLEKYGLSLFIGGLTWILAFILVMVSNYFRQVQATSEIIQFSILLLPIMLVVIAVNLPIYLTFGRERAPLVQFFLIGIIVVIGLITKGMMPSIEKIFNSFPISQGWLTAFLFGVSIFLLCISMYISVGIQIKKEY